ncbi:MAG: DUF3307 domain-containing protein [bacterium]|nr:DUF3307 domain-containing protein [bacterium]
MDQPIIDWANPATTLLALLLCGHILADFLFQTSWMVREKKRSLAALAAHSLEVGLVQGIIVLAFAWSPRGLLLVGGIALTHFAIDWVKASLDKWSRERGLWWLLADQAAHVAVLVLAWKLWPEFRETEALPRVGWAATVLAVFVFNGNGGSAIVAGALATLHQPDGEDEGPKGAGRRIGFLERWMIVGLVWAGQWAAVGLVLTAKSIARFKRMDEQAFAEVYLVGTMTSVLVAMVSGAALQLLL